MVTSLACLLVSLAAISHDSAPATGEPEDDPTRAVGSALDKGGFPWYDSQKDAVKTISLPREPSSSSSSSGSSSSSSSSSSESGSTSSGSSLSIAGFFGNLVSILGLGLALAVLIGMLVWFWRIYEPIAAEEGPKLPKNRAEPSRIDTLPEGMQSEFESSDPWAEAIRRRNRGDPAGAIICLFAHQLLTLSKLGLVRLAPGRTGRQLLRSVSDLEFRGLVHPTLRQFEAVYYGHRIPSTEEFEAIWAGAEAFERRVAAGGVV
jgi:hypothetical protein